MPKIRDYQPTAAQMFTLNRCKAVDELAKIAGFDDEAFAHTEFNLIPFFEAIVEECAKVAEAQAQNYTGENNEGAGCHSAANAIRTFSRNIGNYEEKKFITR